MNEHSFFPSIVGAHGKSIIQTLKIPIGNDKLGYNLV